MKKGSVKYNREFFDRDYSAKEAYGRLWAYARPYRWRIVLGILCGMLTAGTLVPFFQVIQPTLENVSPAPTVQEVKEKPAAPISTIKPKNAIEKEIAKASKMPSWYPQVEKVAQKLGIKLQDEEGAMGGALALLVIVVVPIVALIRLLLVFLNHYCLAWSGMHVVADLRTDILEHIQRQSMQFHGRIDVGQLMSRSTGDPAHVQQIIQHVLQELAQAPFEIIVSVGYIIWFAIANDMLPTLTMIVIGFPLFMIPVVTLSKRIRKWSKKTLEQFSVVGSRIHEILTCIRVVKAYHTEEFESQKYHGVNKHLLKTTLRAVRFGLLVGPAVETVGIFLICAFVVWCFVAHVTLSLVVPMLAPLLIIYKPLKQLSKIQVQVEQGRAALGRIFSILDVEMELSEKPNAVRKQNFTDAIEFKDVSFKYDTANDCAVKGASFTIKRGAVVAVVGSTGSGKSTLSGLLSRFYDPCAGSITMDGVDLRDMAICDLHSLIGSVQQETLLFNDTIAENIRYGTPDATQEQIEAAAKMANAHDFIVAQAGGYSRTVGEKGFALSGGERQRVAIARAILKNPPVLILDEATSALDTVTEREVQEAINRLMSNRTTFVIAHRLSTIRDADLILVMERGVIVERGKHDELLAAGGVYAALCKAQETA